MSFTAVQKLGTPALDHARRSSPREKRAPAGRLHPHCPACGDGLVSEPIGTPLEAVRRRLKGAAVSHCPAYIAAVRERMDRDKC